MSCLILHKKPRVRLQGLTYSVSGGWDSPIDHPGLFAAGGSTARPAEFLEQLERVLRVSN